MRHHMLSLVLILLPVLPALAQDEKKPEPKARLRYGLDYVANTYPQGTPKEAIASAVKAIDANRIDYLLAQIADPAYVDRQVGDYEAQFPGSKEDARKFLAFDKLVSETATYYRSDPLLVRDLRRFARDGTWEMNEDAAVGTVKDLPRKMFFRRAGGRWYLENKQQ